MPDLRFQIDDVVVPRNAATPQLSFMVSITNAEPEPIHTIALRVQVQIEPVRRRYSPPEQEHLKELFGEPERWSKSLQPLLWTSSTINVPGFTGTTTLDLAVPCTFDFNVAVTKYIYGLEDGEIPTSLYFSGTVFHAGRIGLQIAQIPWDREASYRLPVRVWKEMMDRYYPDTAWICLHRETFERLNEYRADHGLATWERALEALLGVSAGAE